MVHYSGIKRVVIVTVKQGINCYIDIKTSAGCNCFLGQQLPTYLLFGAHMAISYVPVRRRDMPIESYQTGRLAVFEFEFEFDM